jgi:hypothetical protein
MSEIELEATEVAETGTEIEPYQPALPATLFGNNPRLALERMTDLAKVLVDVVQSQGLAVKISGRQYLTAEAWSALGALVGVTPVVCWVKQNETGDGYVARVEARTLDGRVVGAAESECSRAEPRWRSREPFQLRSMCQTRGISRSLRAALAVVPVLAGYEPGSSEEMADVFVEPERRAEPEPAIVRPSPEQGKRLRELLVELEARDPGRDWKAVVVEVVGAPFDAWTPAVCDMAIEALEKTLAQKEAA